jgi:hypothetical protein
MENVLVSLVCQAKEPQNVFSGTLYAKSVV